VNWLAIAALTLTLLQWATSGSRTYADDRNDVEKRLSVVETKTSESDRRMERMEKYLERLDGKVDVLLQRGTR
jgi:hypothetical protein